MSANDDSYDVGYGKPPKSGQFTKGKSGNPTGRPKGVRNLASIVIKECRQRVRVNTSRGSRTITKLDAIVMQLVNKAAQGEAWATRDFLPLVERSEDALNSVSAGGKASERDRSLIETVHRRLKELSEDKTFIIEQPSSEQESQ